MAVPVNMLTVSWQGREDPYQGALSISSNMHVVDVTPLYGSVMSTASVSQYYLKGKSRDNYLICRCTDQLTSQYTALLPRSALFSSDSFLY